MLGVGGLSETSHQPEFEALSHPYKPLRTPHCPNSALSPPPSPFHRRAPPPAALHRRRLPQHPPPKKNKTGKDVPLARLWENKPHQEALDACALGADVELLVEGTDRDANKLQVVLTRGAADCVLNGAVFVVCWSRGRARLSAPPPQQTQQQQNTTNSQQARS